MRPRQSPLRSVRRVSQLPPRGRTACLLGMANDQGRQPEHDRCRAARPVQSRSAPSDLNVSVIQTDAWLRQIGPETAKIAYVGRISVGAYAVFERMAVVYRWGTGEDLWGLGDDSCRVSVRYTLGPTTMGPLLSPKVPEKAAQGALWTLCISDAWGVENQPPRGQVRPYRAAFATGESTLGNPAEGSRRGA